MQREQVRRALEQLGEAANGMVATGTTAGIGRNGMVDAINDDEILLDIPRSNSTYRFRQLHDYREGRETVAVHTH